MVANIFFPIGAKSNLNAKKSFQRKIEHCSQDETCPLGKERRTQIPWALLVVEDIGGLLEILGASLKHKVLPFVTLKQYSFVTCKFKPIQNFGKRPQTREQGWFRMAHPHYTIHINILHGKQRTEEASGTVNTIHEIHGALYFTKHLIPDCI